MKLIDINSRRIDGIKILTDCGRLSVLKKTSSQLTQ
jgi:hypothetical protein